MKTVEERLIEKIRFTEECWLWLAGLNRDGYGTFSPYHGHKVLAHRYVYETAVSPIPAGLELDHLCRVRNCVNPDHLEPVTNAENIRRARLEITACKSGHPFNAENTYTRPNGSRSCRECNRLANVLYRAQRREARA